MSKHMDYARDPCDGRLVPCVMCGAAPQIEGLNGVCSQECSDALDKWIEEE